MFEGFMLNRQSCQNWLIESLHWRQEVNVMGMQNSKSDNKSIFQHQQYLKMFTKRPNERDNKTDHGYDSENKSEPNTLKPVWRNAQHCKLAEMKPSQDFSQISQDLFEEIKMPNLQVRWHKNSNQKSIWATRRKVRLCD